MQPLISVILCTHNPRLDYFLNVLAALREQSLPVEQWELLIIDNASVQSLASQFDLSWHPRSKLGLTRARICGYNAASADVLVFVDDDNVLHQQYLSEVIHIFQQHPELGAIAGKSLPKFEVEPESWIKNYYSILALRDFGETPLTTPGDFGVLTAASYPYFAPCGAGLTLRRSLFASYIAQINRNPSRLALGRTGQQLLSGEDNDIILSLITGGWGVGYFPQLQLTHLISAYRLQPNYLARLNYTIAKTWVQVLGMHGIQPWRKIPTWTVLLRQIKAAFFYQPWRNSAAYIQWRGVCGTLAGQSLLP